MIVKRDPPTNDTGQNMSDHVLLPNPSVTHAVYLVVAHALQSAIMSVVTSLSTPG
jgi:hypothetical protein